MALKLHKYLLCHKIAVKRTGNLIDINAPQVSFVALNY